MTPTRLPAIWVHTTTDAFNLPRLSDALAFLTPEQQARLERIRQARMLYDGRHREYFLDEGRTQFDFPRVRAGTQVVQLYLTYNVLGLISLKNADLLFGRAPMLRAEDDAQEMALSDLSQRNGLHALLYGCAVDAGYEGECFLEACAKDGRAYLAQVPADEIFPLGERMPDGQFEQYARYRVRNVGTDEEPVWLLLEVLYLPGRIERRCFQLEEGGRRREVSLDHWAADPQSTIQNPKSKIDPVTYTGIPANTITWIPNTLVRGQPVSDYDGAIELQDALNAKNSQVGRVLLKHSDPRMAFPEEAFDQSTGTIRSDHDVFAYGPDSNRVPRYITWDAALQHALEDRAFILNQLLVRTETSQVLLGMKQGAAPDAYQKVRLEAFNSLTKAQRKTAFWHAGIRRAVGVAQDLENVIPGGPRYKRKPIAVELRDGIPVDEKEQAERLSILRAANLISIERAITDQLHEPAAVRKELTRLGVTHPILLP